MLVGRHSFLGERINRRRGVASSLPGILQLVVTQILFEGSSRTRPRWANRKSGQTLKRKRILWCILAYLHSVHGGRGRRLINSAVRER
jgi:hypothetical protein